MLLNKNHTYDERKKSLSNIVNQDSLINRLFYCSRNLKIIEAISFVEDYFKQQSFKVKADWSESSFGTSAFFKIVLFDKKKEFEYSFTVSRKSFGNTELTSSLIYELKPGTGCYNRYPLSQHHQDFLLTLKSDTFFKLLSSKINFCNYPFNIEGSFDEKSKLTKLINKDEKFYVELFNVAKKSVHNYVLRNIKTYLQDYGFDVSLVLNFDTIKMTLDKFNFDSFIILDKENIKPSIDVSGEMVQASYVGNISGSTSKAKKLNDFVKLITSKEFEKYIKEEINQLNYPFGYESFSSY